MAHRWANLPESCALPHSLRHWNTYYREREKSERADSISPRWQNSSAHESNRDTTPETFHNLTSQWTWGHVHRTAEFGKSESLTEKALGCWDARTPRIHQKIWPHLPQHLLWSQGCRGDKHLKIAFLLPFIECTRQSHRSISLIITNLPIQFFCLSTKLPIGIRAITISSQSSLIYCWNNSFQ